MSISFTHQKSPMAHYYPNGSNHSNRVAAAVDWLGHKMTYTISLSLMELTKIFRAVQPGRHGQCTSVASEIGIRLLRVVRIIALLPLNFTVGMAGIALRGLASYSRTDMTYISPKSYTLPSESCKKLRIRTYNVAMTANFITVPNGVRPVEQRINEVANAMISSFATGDDIICAQEMFHTEAAEQLVQKLKKAFPEIHIIYNVAHSRLNLNSGLMIASKYPLVAPRFWKHPRSEGYSTFANVGHLIVTVLLSSTQKIVLSNTHLNTYGDSPSDNYSGAHCRQEQFRYMEERMQEYLAQNPSKDKLNLVGYFHSGDYNIDLDEEWTECKELSDHYDHNFTVDQHHYPTVFDTRRYPTGWDTKRLDQWKPSMSEQVDYVLVPKKYADRIKGTMRFDDMDGASDHRSVVGDFVFKSSEFTG